MLLAAAVRFKPRPLKIQNKRKLMKTIFLLSAAVISLLISSPSVRAQDLEQDSPVYRELAEQGRLTTGEVTLVYGVPCVEVTLTRGESIKTLVQSLPSLKKKSLMAQDRIALINKTHYLLIVHGSGNISTDKDKMFIPLDYDLEPKILPEFWRGAANREKFILIDLRRQYLGLYEWGNLTHCFPISSGTYKWMPLKNFVILNMDQIHFSSKFDQAPMDHALHIGRDYFIHEGIVPGYPASHGCIRLFPLHARFLFYEWAKLGIPGNIIN